MPVNAPETIFITGRNNKATWARLIQLVTQQRFEMLAGENFGGKANLTKCAAILFELDETAIEELIAGHLHPAFETKSDGLAAYDREFTYDFVREQNVADEKYQFVYNYMHRLTDHPLPSVHYWYQGRPICDYIRNDIYKQYVTSNGGFDQIKWLHDAIRQDGISRRHQMITWIPVIDDFTTSPPCLQRVWTEVLIPKSEWHKYPGCIPVTMHIDYRSWDLGRAMPSNLYGLTRMMYRYVYGNLTAENEYITEYGAIVQPGTIRKDQFGSLMADGKRVMLNDEGNQIEFKVVKLVGFGDNGHLYNDSYNIADRISRC